MKFIKNIKLILIYSLTIPFLEPVETLQAQTDYNRPLNKNKLSLSKKEKRKLRPNYIGIGLGTNASTFRDFATSPLFYNGIVTHISISHLRMDSDREYEAKLSYDFGNYSTNINKNTTISSVKRMEITFSLLYHISLFDSEKFNTKVGMLINGNGNLRNNSALQNNAEGLEAFANLFGSMKFTINLNRKQEKEKRFLFFNFKLNERKQNLAFRLNLGLINSSYRNGYVYTNQYGILNELGATDGHEYKLFSGFRISSNFEYIYYLKNKNAIQLSYKWDAYTTGGDLDKFEMAHHILKLTLLFNTDNR